MMYVSLLFQSCKCTDRLRALHLNADCLLCTTGTGGGSDTGAMQLLANEGATAHQLVHSLPAILHVLAGRAEPTVADLQGILGRWHFLAV